MASTSGARRRSQKYPDELRERSVRMVAEIRRETGETHGVIARVASELGIGVESLRQWVNRAEVDSGTRPGTSTADALRIAQLERENKSFVERTIWRNQAVAARTCAYRSDGVM